MEMLLYRSDINPKYCPAHLHDAISTYELWVNQIKFITDSGNFSYNTDTKRHYYRSSYAHNISTTLNGSQSALVKSFRYGKRAKIISFNQTHNSFEIIYFEVINYFSSQKIKRKVYQNNRTITVNDTTSSYNSKSYIHLDPNVKILENKSNSYILEKNGKKLYLNITSPIKNINLINTGYSDSFYNEKTKQTIEVIFDNNLEYTYTYD
jgi:hypothetical protein